MARCFRLYPAILFILIALLVGCAPDDLDITPTATATPQPTATPSPTPLPANFVDPNAANENALSLILDTIPVRIPAGAVEWRRDISRGEDGIEPVARAENGAGAKIYYTEQTGGQMNLTFAVFNTPDDAAAHYQFIKGIRQPLITGNPNDTLPQPNIFGSGLYGSVAIFQIETVFIEVNIELFSSTQGNPLVPLARETIRYFEQIQPDLESAPAASPDDNEASASGDPLMDAIIAALPTQILGDAIWNQDTTRFDGLQIQPPNFDTGTVIRVFYREQTGGALQITFGVFASTDDALAQYDRFRGIREGLEAENIRDNFPQPHIFGQGLYGSVALFQIDNAFIEVLIERAPGTIPNPLESIARRMLQTLEQAQESL
jgi:hypothetical protein